MLPIELSQADLSALVDLAPELNEDTALESLLGRLLASAVRLTSSTAGSVYLYDERRRKLYVAHAVGPEAQVVLAQYGAAGVGVPLVGSKSGAVFASGEPIVENEVGEDPEHFKAVDRATGLPTRSMVAVPLVVSGDRIGVVQLLNRTTGPYTDYELALLEKFAGLAAVAVRNARLFGDLAAHMGAYGLDAGAVSAGTLRTMLTAPAHLERVSVLFADMRGYTQLEQTVRQPENLQAKLNEFLALLANCVIARDGVVNKYLGDGLMALFRGPGHELRAVECAMTMVDGFTALRDRWDVEMNESIAFLDLGVGIATDTVMVGTIGSDRVREFTAIGRAVSLAALLVRRARNGHRILTDRMTYRAVSAHVEQCHGPESIELKNLGPNGPRYEVYEIVALRSASGGEVADPAARPTATGAPAGVPHVFVSYAHDERPWLDELKTHLRPFLRREDFELWDDTRIAVGDRWREDIEAALARAGAAVLLVSPRFLSSEFIDRQELPPLIEAARRRGLRIFWIPISASAYDQTEIANYQAAHDPRRPLDQLPQAERNAAWVKICREIAGGLRPAP